MGCWRSESNYVESTSRLLLVANENIDCIRREDHGRTVGSAALPQLLSHRIFPVQFSDV